MSWHYIFLDVVLEYQALYRWVDLRFCRRVGYWLSVCLVLIVVRWCVRCWCGLLAVGFVMVALDVDCSGVCWCLWLLLMR